MQFRKKIAEILLSVLPVITVVIILHFTIAPLDPDTFFRFLIGAAMLMLGLTLFNCGAGISVIYIGQSIGEFLTKSRNLWLVVLFGLITGFSVTLAEPDLQVLAGQVNLASGGQVSRTLLMVMVSIGVGIFVSLALFRVAVKIRLSHIISVSYLVVFVLAVIVWFVSPDFFAVAFDSGGVTTGPMTVPFIMALGIGAASVRSQKGSNVDSFGMIALGSVGPIIAVFALALLFGRTPSEPAAQAAAQTMAPQGNLAFILHILKEEAWSVLLALLPMSVIFIIMQFCLKLSGTQLRRVALGMVLTYAGLVLLLTGVNVGFSPAASAIGKSIASGNLPWLLVPVGVLLGFVVVGAEPAIHVLVREVEEVSGGYIKRRLLLGALCISVAISVGLAMMRVLTGISLWWFIAPGYLIAFLLMLKAPSLFFAIAFDSGGVATGPMTVTFLLAMAMGASEYISGNVLADAFGLVAFVAMMPLITIQAMGWMFKIKEKRIRQLQREAGARVEACEK